MDEKRLFFVEWKEQFVSKEKGHQIVHYFLKDVTGEFVLAVKGTERSLRHMFYIVADEFLKAVGEEDSVNAGYRWRSRREVVNWLTSMLSSQHKSKSPKSDITYEPGQQTEDQGPLTENLGGHTLDIVWAGNPWACGKQLKHYPLFRKNKVDIAIQSFVFVMAEEGDHHLAYLEDMYEDKKGQKKVRARWLHRLQEVKGVASLQNHHPKEVFITPYAQVTSAECIDGPATILTPEHYERFLEVIPGNLLARVYVCHRQVKGNRVKAFKLSNLHGYFDQSIFGCVGPDFFEDEFSPGENSKVGAKRTRNCENATSLHEVRYENREIYQRQVRPLAEIPVKVNDKIEFLCLDSGIRGCWFNCTVLKVKGKKMKVRYEDLKDVDDSGNLEEWLPTFRVADPDKLGMRYPGRPCIRPAVDHYEVMRPCAFEIGSPVDAWWCDRWWEGVVARTADNENHETLQVCIPSESFLLKINRNDLRVSRDWTGDKWVDIEPNLDIASNISTYISPEMRISALDIVTKEPDSNKTLTATKLDMVEQERPAGLENLVPFKHLLIDTNQAKGENHPLVEEIEKVSTPIDTDSPGKETGVDYVARNVTSELEDAEPGRKENWSINIGR